MLALSTNKSSNEKEVVSSKYSSQNKNDSVFQEIQGKAEHSSLVSVAEEMVPTLPKTKSKTGNKILGRIQELKTIQNCDESNELKENPMKDAIGQPQNSQTKCLKEAKEKQIRRDTDQKSGKTRNATKQWRKAKCSETSQAPAGSSLAINKGSKSKGESTSDKI